MKIAPAFLLSFLLCSSVDATVLTVTATGTLSEYFDPDGMVPWPSLTVGTTQVAMTFQYDSAQSVMGVATGAADYGFFPYPITMEIEGFTVQYSQHNVTIFDDRVYSDSLTYDAWQSSAAERASNAPFADLVRGITFLLNTDRDAAPVPTLTSTALVAPVWPGEWGRGVLEYRVVLDVPGPGFESVALVRANIDSVVVTPAPSAVILLVTALGTLCIPRAHLLHARRFTS